MGFLFDMFLANTIDDAITDVTGLAAMKAMDKRESKYEDELNNIINLKFSDNPKEIFEECGCNVELSGILRLGNTLIPDNNVVTIIFSTKLIEENIKFNSDEILDVKWFSYEEIVKMEDELRYYDWIIDAITSYRNNEVVDLSLVRIF